MTGPLFQMQMQCGFPCVTWLCARLPTLKYCHGQERWVLFFVIVSTVRYGHKFATLNATTFWVAPCLRNISKHVRFLFGVLLLRSDGEIHEYGIQP